MDYDELAQLLGLVYMTFVFLIFISAIVEFWFFDRSKRLMNIGEDKMIAKGMAVTGLLSGGTAVIAKPISIATFAFVGAELAILSIGDINHWYEWIICFLIYEFSYWLHHCMLHKDRLLWCVHAPHHSPNTINMLVGFNHSFIEALFYMPLMLGLLPVLMGVDPIIVMAINILDFAWGSALHVSEGMVKKRYGLLEKFLQTPSYHRAHHAQNLEYMDTNYNSITLFWDNMLGTKAELKDDNPVVYGVTSDVDTCSYFDTHFGQFKKLWIDVKNAPNLKNKLGYIFMPPGWSHTGEHTTVSAQKKLTF